MYRYIAKVSWKHLHISGLKVLESLCSVLQDGTFWLFFVSHSCCFVQTQDVNCASNYLQICSRLIFGGQSVDSSFSGWANYLYLHHLVWFILFQKCCELLCCATQWISLKLLASLLRSLQCSFKIADKRCAILFCVCVPPLPRYDGNSLLSSIECYDPVIDSWEVVTSMATQRCDAGVCVLREKWFFFFLSRQEWRKMKRKRKDWQLDFALKKNILNQSHTKDTRSMAVCKKASSKERSTSCLWHTDGVLQEIEFGDGRLGKRPRRSSSPPAWLSWLSLLPMRLFFQFVLKVQYISTHYDKTFKKKERERETELI